MDKKFREAKYLNETGSKMGSWYLNRMDYFQFHQYPSYKKHKTLSLILTLLLYYAGLYLIKSSFWASLPVFYLAYVAMFTFNILRTRVCRYNGYFLYPSKLIRFFKSIEIEVDVNDFDSIATMNGKK